MDVPPADRSRRAVVDLGSNSVRLVVFEGRSRNPVAIFNEKAVLRLGRGLQDTGRLNESGMAEAFRVMHRYGAIARAMGAEPFEALATAAVRDAANGPDFVAALGARLPDVPIRVLSGVQEAEFSAEGLLCGMPDAHGILADIGGGSLELVRLADGRRAESQTLRLGVIRLSDRSGGDLDRARDIAEADLSGVPWASAAGGDLFLVGGAWRAFARIHMNQKAWPLRMIHGYAIDGDEARDLAGMIASAGKRALERMPGVSRRRVDDLPMAAVVLRRLLRAGRFRRAVFSASGLREGWYMRGMPSGLREEDPLLAAARDMAATHGRAPDLPSALLAWTDPLFPREGAAERRLREAACWMSDVGSHDHPEFRAEQAFHRVLRQPALGLDHPTRAFLSLAVAMRYEVDEDASFLRAARLLLDVASLRRAEVLGVALRLAYTLSAGTRELLAGAALRQRGGKLALALAPGSGVFAGEAVMRRLDRLAQAMGLEAATEDAALAAE